jgi:DegV family protein with EDD domain
MQIVTDSAADLTPEDIKTWNIHVIPLYIQFPDGEVAASDITPDAFYDKLKSIVPKVPTTSQPSIGLLSETFEKFAATNTDVLAIHVSSGLSGTYSVASTAGRQAQGHKVTAIDAMTLSGGQRFQVLAAAMALKAGWPMDKLIERLALIRAHTETMYTLETLEYLQRGGRIGRVQALAGSILGIKPIIKVDKADGKYSTVGRARSVNQALTNMATSLKATYGDKPVWATVLHGQFSEKADLFTKNLKETLNISKLEVLRISPVLGVHTGPGIVGACITPMDGFEGLL